MSAWKNYPPAGFYDELIDADGRARAGASAVVDQLQALSTEALVARQKAADRAIVEMGITFTVYSEGQNIDRAWPLDIIPRVIDGSRVAANRSRAAPATDRAQHVHRRYLSRPACDP